MMPGSEWWRCSGSNWECLLRLFLVCSILLAQLQPTAAGGGGQRITYIRGTPIKIHCPMSTLSNQPLWSYRASLQSIGSLDAWTVFTDYSYDSQSQHLLIHALQPEQVISVGICRSSDGLHPLPAFNVSLAFYSSEFIEDPVILNRHPLREGGLVALRCVPPRMQPQGNVLWLKNGATIRADYRSVFTLQESGAFVLLLLNASNARDGGVYQCKALHVMTSMISHPLHLSILTFPLAKEGSSSSMGGGGGIVVQEALTVSRGGTKTLSCSTLEQKTTSDSVVVWSRLDRPHLNIIHQERIFAPSAGQLHMNNVQLADTGTYVCFKPHAEDPPSSPSADDAVALYSLLLEGRYQAVKVFHLLVTSPPIVMQSWQSMEPSAPKNSMLLLPCQFVSYPPPLYIYWDLPTGKRITTPEENITALVEGGGGRQFRSIAELEHAYIVASSSSSVGGAVGRHPGVADLLLFNTSSLVSTSQLRHELVFVCGAESAIGRHSVRVSLSLLPNDAVTPPLFERPPPEMLVLREGQRGQLLTCWAQQNTASAPAASTGAALSMKWMKDGKLIATSSEHGWELTEDVTVTAPGERRQKLLFEVIRKEHAGQYACVTATMVNRGGGGAAAGKNAGMKSRTLENSWTVSVFVRPAAEHLSPFYPIIQRQQRSVPRPVRAAVITQATKTSLTLLWTSVGAGSGGARVTYQVHVCELRWGKDCTLWRLWHAKWPRNYLTYSTELAAQGAPPPPSSTGEVLVQFQLRSCYDNPQPWEASLWLGSSDCSDQAFITPWMQLTHRGGADRPRSSALTLKHPAALPASAVVQLTSVQHSPGGVLELFWRLDIDPYSQQFLSEMHFEIVPTTYSHCGADLVAESTAPLYCWTPYTAGPAATRSNTFNRSQADAVVQQLDELMLSRHDWMQQLQRPVLRGDISCRQSSIVLHNLPPQRCLQFRATSLLLHVVTDEGVQSLNVQAHNHARNAFLTRGNPPTQMINNLHLELVGEEKSQQQQQQRQQQQQPPTVLSVSWTMQGDPVSSQLESKVLFPSCLPPGEETSSSIALVLQFHEIINETYARGNIAHTLLLTNVTAKTVAWPMAHLTPHKLYALRALWRNCWGDGPSSGDLLRTSFALLQAAQQQQQQQQQQAGGGNSSSALGALSWTLSPWFISICVLSCLGILFLVVFSIQISCYRKYQRRSPPPMQHLPVQLYLPIDPTDAVEAGYDVGNLTDSGSVPAYATSPYLPSSWDRD